MKSLLADGELIDIALAVIGIELVALVVLGLRGRSRLRPLDVLGQLLAGAMLMLAVRSAVTGADYRWTLAFLTASFPAHIYDLARRLRGTSYGSADREREPMRRPPLGARRRE